MGDKTGIEWCDATWSPIAAFRRDNGKRGWHCEKVSAACAHCYAETFNRRGLQSGTALPYTRASRDLVEIRAVNLDVPLRWRRPRRIFVESMSDLFADFVPDELIDRVFAVMALSPQHTFQVLTKRPERMRAYVADKIHNYTDRAEDVARLAAHVGKIVWDGRGSDPANYYNVAGGAGDVSNRRVWPGWPLPNAWLGVSVEDQATADARIPLLLQTPAAVRFVSYEPALGPVDFRPYVTTLDVLCCPGCGFRTNRLEEFGERCPNGCARLGFDVSPDWIIVGGESGPGARPFDVAWARSTIAQCRAASVPVFCKQLGSAPAVSGAEADPSHPTFKALEFGLRDRKGGDMEEWPEDLRVREFPAGRS